MLATWQELRARLLQGANFHVASTQLKPSCLRPDARLLGWGLSTLDHSPGSMTSSRQFALDIVTRLRAAGYIAYWAGGCVRDLLLGKTPKDYDVATDAHPEQVQSLFGPKRTRAVGVSFGVILIHGPGDATDVEVATFRSEGPYLDGRRPEHVVYSTPEEDAQRRDFTINGMFYDPVAEQVLDYVGGQADLASKRVRAIGNPLERFREDKLRLLRAIRFAATLQFELDEHTADAIREMACEITIVSAERIAQEWKRMLVDSHRVEALHLAKETLLLGYVFPESLPLLGADAVSLQHWNRAYGAVRRLVNPRFELVLATWLCDVPGYSPAAARALCQRLRLSNEELDRLVWLKAQANAITGARTFPLSQLKRLLSHPDALDLLAQTRARLEASDDDVDDVAFCETYLRTTPVEIINPPPLITGDDLIRHGLRPGKQFKTLLDSLRDAQLENRITSFDEALRMALDIAGQRES